VALRWYVVHAYSNFEHKVAESLKERIKLHALFDPTQNAHSFLVGNRRRLFGRAADEAKYFRHVFD
jgi:transcriptional antiterminator NusG